jgi:hypothetical protein
MSVIYTLTTNTTYLNDEKETKINEEENLLNIKYHLSVFCFFSSTKIFFSCHKVYLHRHPKDILDTENIHIKYKKQKTYIQSQ